MNKIRGAFLTITLAFYVLLFVFGLFALFSVSGNQSVTLPVSDLVLSMIKVGVSIVSIVGIWLWKKWAVFLFGAFTVYQIIDSIIRFNQSYSNIGGFALSNLLLTLIPAVLLLWAISRKWKFFE